MIWFFALWETRNELKRQAVRRAEELAQAGSDEESSGANRDESQSKPNGDAKGASDRRLDELFRQAQRHYLAGDWVLTEQTLASLLRIDRDDIEAQLLLAAVWRLSDRPEKARRTLERLSRRQDAEGWSYEINDELTRLAPPQAPEQGETEQAAADTLDQQQTEVLRLADHQTDTNPTTDSTDNQRAA